MGVTTISSRLTCELSSGYNSLNIYRIETINGLCVNREGDIARSVFAAVFLDQRFSGLE